MMQSLIQKVEAGADLSRQEAENAMVPMLLERQGAWAARSTWEAGDDIAERVAG